MVKSGEPQREADTQRFPERPFETLPHAPVERTPIKERVGQEREVPSAEYDMPSVTPAPSPQAVAPVVVLKSKTVQAIEHILEQDLDELFLKLDPRQQQQFKIKGEQTASRIETLLQSTKVKMYEIFRLVVEWLRMIPGVNRFFIEQEAKIKADKILNIKNQNE